MSSGRVLKNAEASNNKQPMSSAGKTSSKPKPKQEKQLVSSPKTTTTEEKPKDGNSGRKLKELGGKTDAKPVKKVELPMKRAAHLQASLKITESYNQYRNKKL